MYEKFSDALILATQAHKGQIRKFSQLPYIMHPIQVASIIATITKDEDVIIAGLLHDVIEDCGISSQRIRDEFGEKVLNLVMSETENKRPDKPKSDTWMIRKEESLQELKNTKDINVKILWLSDKLSNLRSYTKAYEQLGPQMWDRLNQKDPAMHKWYNETVLSYTKELSDTDAYKEMVHLSEVLFGGEKQ